MNQYIPTWGLLLVPYLVTEGTSITSLTIPGSANRPTRVLSSQLRSHSFFFSSIEQVDIEVWLATANCRLKVAYARRRLLGNETSRISTQAYKKKSAPMVLVGGPEGLWVKVALILEFFVTRPSPP